MRPLVLCLAALVGCSEGSADVPEADEAAAATAPPALAEPPPQSADAPDAPVPATETTAAPAGATPAAGGPAATAVAANEPAAPQTAAPQAADNETGPRLPDATSGAGRQRVFGPAPPPVREWVEIVLRSTPPGATVSVDGAIVGTTPTFWRGAKIPAAREFRFSLERHQPADFTFVPIKSGVLHPSLVPTRDKPDADSQR